MPHVSDSATRRVRRWNQRPDPRSASILDTSRDVRYRSERVFWSGAGGPRVGCDPKGRPALGASGWWYEVDFQEDLSIALSELQQRIFESGEYLHPWNSPWFQPDAEYDEELVQEAAEESGIREGDLRASMERLKSGCNRRSAGNTCLRW